MFDGSTPSNISKKVWMPITFSTGETHHLEFFVMTLDENYSLVLGYDWLARYNLSIDWTETKITFRELKHPKGKPASSKKVDIRMVSALMMTTICRPRNTTTRQPQNNQPSGCPNEQHMPRGRVKDEERRRRRENNLCLYCGKSDHTIAKCPATTKGWVAVLPSKTTTEMSTPEPTEPTELSQLNK